MLKKIWKCGKKPYNHLTNERNKVTLITKVEFFSYHSHKYSSKIIFIKQVGQGTNRINCTASLPALRSWSAWPGRAMAPKAAPLKSKCTLSARHGPPGHWSVITTVTGLPEQALCPMHLTCHSWNSKLGCSLGFEERGWTMTLCSYFSHLITGSAALA